MSLGQNVLILFANNIYIRNVKVVSHIILYMKTWYSSSSLSIFLIWFLGPKCPNTPILYTTYLYNSCLNLFERHYKHFPFKFKFLDFSNNSVPHFEKLQYLLNLNDNESDQIDKVTFPESRVLNTPKGEVYKTKWNSLKAENCRIPKMKRAIKQFFKYCIERWLCLSECR